MNELTPWPITHIEASCSLGSSGYGTYVVTDKGDRLAIDFQTVRFAKRIEHVPLSNGNVRSTVVEWFDPKPEPKISELAKLVAAAPAMKKALLAIRDGGDSIRDAKALAAMAITLTEL